MFIELTALFYTGSKTTEEKILVNIEHIAMVRPKNSHTILCFSQGNVFTTFDVKESYGQVNGLIHSAIKSHANLRRLGHDIR